MTATPVSEAKLPDPDLVTEALSRLEAWEGLSGSARLRSILRYIVTEALEGRGADLRAKTIAFDVYGYSPDELIGRESVVRVDAGRLRRKLLEYAEGPGAEDALNILLEKGSYRPVFDQRVSSTAQEDEPRNAALAVSPKLVAVFGVVAALVVAFLFVGRSAPPEPELSAVEVTTQRGAIFEASPERLSAINLAEDGRDLIFPALDPNRLRASLQVFQAAIDADPDYFGGYAGAAQVQSMFSLLTTDPEISASALVAARTAYQRARQLSPGDPWSESAHAWTAFAAKDFETAKRLSARAVSLAPDDAHILEFDALISLFTGEFERVISEAARARALYPDQTGSVFTNAAGSARFHSGDYQGTLEQFITAIEAGGPVGPASMAYMMASHYKVGNADRAAELAAQFEKNWPSSTFDKVFGALFMDPQYGAELTEAMRAAGWNPSH